MGVSVLAKIKKKIKNNQIVISCKLEGIEAVNQAELACINAPVTYGFAPVSVSGKKLVFSMPNYMPVAAWLANPLDRAGFYRIVFRVLDVIYAVNSNNLNINNLDIRPDSIYLDNSMSQIFFVYYPIANGERFNNNIISLFYELVNCAIPAFPEDDYKAEFFNYLAKQPVVSVTDMLKFSKAAAPGVYDRLDNLNLRFGGDGVDPDETVLFDEAPVILSKNNRNASLTEELETTIYLDDEAPAPAPSFEQPAYATPAAPAVDPDATVLLDEDEIQVPNYQPVYAEPAAPAAPAVDPDATVLLDEDEIQVPNYQPAYAEPTPAPVEEEYDPEATVMLDEDEVQIPAAPVYEAPQPTYEEPAPAPVEEEYDPEATVMLDEDEVQIPAAPVYEAPQPAYEEPAPAPVEEEYDPEATVMLDEDEVQIPAAPVYEVPQPAYEEPAPAPVEEEYDPEATVILDESEVQIPEPAPVEDTYDPEATVILEPEVQEAPAEEAYDPEATTILEPEIPEVPAEEPDVDATTILQPEIPAEESDVDATTILQPEIPAEEPEVDATTILEPEIPENPAPQPQPSDETVPLDVYAAEEKDEEGSVLYEAPQTEEQQRPEKSEYNSGDTVLLSDIPQRRAFLILPKRNIEVEVTGSKFVVGADDSCCDLKIDNTSISRMHLTIKNDSDEFYAVDNGSTNGTLFNGIPMKKGEPVKLSDLDRLVLANEIVDIKIVEEK